MPLKAMRADAGAAFGVCRPHAGAVYLPHRKINRHRMSQIAKGMTFAVCCTDYRMGPLSQDCDCTTETAHFSCISHRATAIRLAEPLHSPARLLSSFHVGRAFDHRRRT